MDFEYIEHIQGSPYITEGGWDRFKAKAAQQMGTWGAQMGHQIADPTETQLRSFWEGFVKTLKGVMKDWSGQIEPMFDATVQLQPQDEAIKEIMDQLVTALQPPGMGKLQPVGQYKNLGYHSDPGVRNPRDNPDSYVKGSTYNRSTTSPSLKSLAPKQAVDYSIEEGLWDKVTRDKNLNQAVGSNNPTKILLAYKKYILSYWKEFLADASKNTGKSSKKIIETLLAMKGSGNMPEVVRLLLRLINAGRALPNPNKKKNIKKKTPAAGAGTPGSGTGTPGAGQPPPTPPATPQPSPQPPQQPQPPQAGQGQGQMQGGSGSDIPPEMMGDIIKKAMEIIINAVKGDIGHSSKYFGAAKDASGKPIMGMNGKAKYPDLPTSFVTKKKKPTPTPAPAAPTTTTEADDPAAAAGADTGDEPDDKEYPGEFLYNFHSKKRKYPGQPFSIEVKPMKDEDRIIKGGPADGVVVTVYWESEKKVNKIWVEAEKDGVEYKPFLMAMFWDDEVNSKAGASTPGHSNLFSIEKILDKAEQTLPDDQKKSKHLGQAYNAIKALEPDLLRAMMATAERKTKEFKKKSPNAIKLYWDSDGTVHFPESGTEMSKDKIQAALKGPYVEAQKLAQSLDSYGYFDEFPDVEKPMDVTDYPAWKEAATILGQNKYPESQAAKLLAQAWDKLLKAKKDQNAIDGKELANLAMGQEAPLGENAPTWDKDGTVHFPGGVMPIPKNKVAYLEDPAKQELEKAGYFKEFPDAMNPPPKKAPAPEPTKGPEKTPEPEKPKVSAPAGGPPPQSPVSKEPSKPAAQQPPASPVSNKDKEDAAQPQAGGKMVVLGWNDDGSINVKDSKGNQVKAPPHVIQDVPELKAQLMKLGYWDKFPNVPGKPDPSGPEEQPPQQGGANPANAEIQLKGKGVQWIDKTGKTHEIDGKDIKGFGKVNPDFEAAMNKHPEILQQLKSLNAKIGQKKKKGGDDKKVSEGLINPFVRDNFL